MQEGHSLWARVIETLAAMLSACLVNSVLDAGGSQRGARMFIHSFQWIPLGVEDKKSPRIIRTRERLCAARAADIILERRGIWVSFEKLPSHRRLVRFFSFFFFPPPFLLRLPFYSLSLSLRDHSHVVCPSL